MCPNVYAKISGLVTEADWSLWSPHDLEPYVDWALQLRSHRSDVRERLARVHVGRAYSPLETAEILLSKQTASERDAIFCRTAYVPGQTGRSGDHMKLLRVGVAGNESPCVLADDGTILDLTPLTDDIDGAFWDTARRRQRRSRPRHARPDSRNGPSRRPTPQACRQDRLRRSQLRRPRRRDRRRRTAGTDPFMKAPTPSSGPTTPCSSRGERTRPTRRSSSPSSSARTARYLGVPAEEWRRSPATRSPTTSPNASSSSTRRPMGQGQELRDVQPARTVAGHGRRGRRPAEGHVCCRRLTSTVLLTWTSIPSRGERRVQGVLGKHRPNEPHRQQRGRE